MLYTILFHLHTRLLRQTIKLLALLLVIVQPGFIQAHAQTNDLFGNNLKLPSSEADNSLIDTDTIDTPEPEISPAEAAEVVRKKVGGQVMSVNTQRRESGVVYGVKVLNDGRMRVIHVDGHTGRLLNQ